MYVRLKLADLAEKRSAVLCFWNPTDMSDFSGVLACQTRLNYWKWNFYFFIVIHFDSPPKPNLNSSFSKHEAWDVTMLNSDQRKLATGSNCQKWSNATSLQCLRILKYSKTSFKKLQEAANDAVPRLTTRGWFQTGGILVTPMLWSLIIHQK